MKWFKKFTGEVKNTGKQNKSVLDLFELEEKEKTTMNRMANKIALVNKAIQQYGNPTITYKGETYTSKMLKTMSYNKDVLTYDEKIMYNMMINTMNEKLDELAEYDEDGYVIDTDDEVLNAYLTFLKNESQMLKWLLKKAK